MRASPQIFSEVIGFSLWGIELEPSCPALRPSNSSLTSDRIPWRTSRAKASQIETKFARL